MPGPVNMKMVDASQERMKRTAEQAKKIKSSTRGSDKDNDAIQSKLTAERLRIITNINAVQKTIQASSDQLLVLDIKRKKIAEAQADATRKGNIEVQDHYRKQLQILDAQVKYVKQTVSLEDRRRKQLQAFDVLEKKRLDLETKNKKLSSDELKVWQKQAGVSKQIHDQLVVRTKIQETALKTGLSIKESEQQVLNTLEKQEAYRAKIKEHLDGALRDTKLIRREEGISAKQALVLGVVGGVTAGIGVGKGMEHGKTAMTGFAEASDVATEAQYAFGNSLNRNDKTFGGYASRASKLVTMNTELGIAFTKMGLSVEDAQKMLPTLLSSNGQALKAYQNQNYDLLATMAKDAGAFSRRTGISVDEATQLQGQLMSSRGLTAKQATDEMDTIAASVVAMNDKLGDAGFKGANLSIQEFANMAKQAAENTESLSFNVGDYAKRMAIAAKNARLLGATEKEASKYATFKGELMHKKDAYLDLKQGTKIVDVLRKTYAKEIASGDVGALAKRLVDEQKMNPGQAMIAASAMMSKTPVPMLENNMAELFRSTSLQNTAWEETFKDFMKSANVNSMADIARLVFASPQVTQALGIDVSDAAQMNQVSTLVNDYLMSTGKIKPTESLAPMFKNAEKQSDADAIDKAKKGVSSSGVTEGSGLNIRTTTSGIQSIWNSPWMNALKSVGAFGGAGIGAGVTGLGVKLMRGKSAAGAVAEPAKQGIGSLFSRMFGKGTAPAVEGIEKGLGAEVKTGLMAALRRNKATKIALGIAGGAAALWGGSKLLGGGGDRDGGNLESLINPNKAQSAADADKPVDSLDDNTKATQANTQAMLSARGSKDSANNPISQPTQEQKPYTQTLGQNAADSVLGGAVGFAGLKGVKYAKSLFGKTAAKEAGKEATKMGLREIPVAGIAMSSALTYAMTKGSIGRKLSAAAGDAIGTAIGQVFTGDTASWATGIAGEGIGVSMYDALNGGSFLPDWLAGENAKSKLDTSGSLDSVSRLDASTSQQAQQQAQSQQSTPSITAGLGAFGTVRSDGSVDTTLNIRLSNFVPAVNQANTIQLARTTQYSGALNK